LSIALVIALAIAVIYYGGDSTKSAKTRSVADTLVNQSLQINAAGTIATAQGANWPANGPQFGDPYLTAMPVPPKSAYVDGLSPDASDWEYLLADGSSHHFVLRDKIRKEVCLAVNKMMGFSGIPASWDGASVIQCYGTGQSVPGAYTYLYSPPSTSPAQQAGAQNQTNTEGGTTTPGYPRLCADGTTIASGLCPDSGNGAAGPSAGGDPSQYHALRVDNFKGIAGGETITFTAVTDCSGTIPAGSVCLPAFQSRHTSWQWDTTGSATTYGSMYMDAQGAYTTVNEYGFSISDGTNVYTVQGSTTSGNRNTYVYVNDYPRSAVGDGSFVIDCANAKADILSKGGTFLPNLCTTIQTKGQYAWTFNYTDINQFDTRAVNSVNLGMYYNSTQSATQYSFQTYASTDVNKLIIGKVSAPYTDTVPTAAQSGNTGRWPMAPLDTTAGTSGPM
jgi:hypothetical protein